MQRRCLKASIQLLKQSTTCKRCSIPRRIHRGYSTQPPKQEAPRETSDFNRLAWNSVAAFATSSALLFAYFQYEQFAQSAKRDESKNVSVGKPLIGGPFALTDHFGKAVTSEDYKGKFVLLYFGYTFCPDVCPEELEKMAKVVDALDGDVSVGRDKVTPLFVSCDPRRDTPGIIKEYLAEYHPKFIGLTGTYDQIKQCAKAYRFYFSAPPNAADGKSVDYLVDHSIFFYLLDPEGKYVAHFGRSDAADTVAERVKDIILKYRSDLVK
ncbi:hypothetical protein SmJEL517_g01386 [Synchytrium microbalum]|uniref:Thioredoxin domain-containing protein n=1 Tax=Synchytrium microbalum TaxID=1806994 RepID=A0A507CGN6_9FUNG|nr:uncharacterized protein SmJEL517_g01386 [Synchytrium microbalum]TPX36683.1 hypothetical protein SmJEL517_g01386 [Synchytrium microbalum]